MPKKFFRILTASVIVVVLCFLLFGTQILQAQAQNDSSGTTRLVPCTDKCGWNDFITLVNNVINFILIDLAVPFAAIMFAYAGGLLMFSGGEVSKREQAKKIIINVAIGLAVIAGAWIIVHTVFSILGYDASWIGF